MIKRISETITKLSFVKFQIIKIILLNTYTIMYLYTKGNIPIYFILLVFVYCFLNLFASYIDKKSTLGIRKECIWIIIEVLSALLYVYVVLFD